MTVTAMGPGEPVALFDLLNRKEQRCGLVRGRTAPRKRHHHELSKTCNENDEQARRDNRFDQREAIGATRNPAVGVVRHAASCSHVQHPIRTTGVRLIRMGHDR